MGHNRHTPGFLWIVSLAQQVSKMVARHVQRFSYFDQRSVGEQLQRAVDSIGLNLSEGYARAHPKEKIHFYSIAEGSLEEALFAVRLARDRGLIQRLEASILSGLLIRLGTAIQRFVASLKP